MSDFDDWKADQYLMSPEAVRIIAGQDIIAVKAIWLNPPGVRSTRMSADIPLMADDSTLPGHMEQRNVVVGWKCVGCGTILFGTVPHQLLHHPRCTAYLAPDITEAEHESRL